MKNLFIILFIPLLFFSCSFIDPYYPSYQEKKQEIENINGNKIIKNITETRILPFSSNEFIERINTSTNDTTYYIYNGFQNSRYQTIIDIGSVFISSKRELNQLIEDLEDCLNFMNKYNQVYTIRRTGDYSLYIYDFSNNLYIYSNSDKSTGGMSKKNVEKWIEWLSTINIP